ncbi:unnamed protein product [Dovyalis caffra]|uniref:Uncharacterized protein n=1 Tax=Dovyalis caffra TaxID=77055 RepID=A0AAV1RDP4_9ROSI|nr:unnamed protein product [Dovyalis caffra]
MYCCSCYGALTRLPKGERCSKSGQAFSEESEQVMAAASKRIASQLEVKVAEARALLYGYLSQGTSSYKLW